MKLSNFFSLLALISAIGSVSMPVRADQRTDRAAWEFLQEAQKPKYRLLSDFDPFNPPGSRRRSGINRSHQAPKNKIQPTKLSFSSSSTQPQLQAVSDRPASLREEIVDVQLISLEEGASFQGREFEAGCVTTNYLAKDAQGQKRMVFKRKICNPVVLPPYVASNEVSVITRSGLVIPQTKVSAEKIWNRLRDARSACPLTLHVTAREGLIRGSDFQCNKVSELNEEDQVDSLSAEPAV